MADQRQDLYERIVSVEKKVDSLTASIYRRFTSIDQRFDSIDQRFTSIDQRFTSIDQRFDSIDRRFEEVTESFVEQRRYTDFAFDRLNASLSTLEAKMDSGFARLDRKLDQLIDRA